MTDEHHALWLERFRAVSRAQSRYLYALLVLSLFFWALRGEVNSAGADEKPITVPLVGLSLQRGEVLAAGPIVLPLVGLAVLGSLRAVTVAFHNYKRSDSSHLPFEAIDTNPNAIDLIVYSNSSSGWARLGLLSYPGFVSLSLLESIVLLRWVLCSSLTYKHIIFLVGAFLSLAVAWGLAPVWRSKVRQLRGT